MNLKGYGDAGRHEMGLGVLQGSIAWRSECVHVLQIRQAVHMTCALFWMYIPLQLQSLLEVTNEAILRVGFFRKADEMKLYRQQI